MNEISDLSNLFHFSRIVNCNIIRKNNQVVGGGGEQERIVSLPSVARYKHTCWCVGLAKEKTVAQEEDG